MKKEAELVSTGAELLSGRSTNTHARLIGERVGRLGISLRRDTTVADDIDTIQQAVKDAAQRVDLVFVTGGLGPTNDDLSRDAVAALLGRRVVMDEPSLEQLRVRMERVGREMTPARQRQALIVEGAEVLPNSVGAAPGERIEQDGKTYILLPGPPAELRAILDEQVLPWLAVQWEDTAALRERILLVRGLGEGDVVPRFEQAAFPPPGITTAYCAGAGRLEVRLHPDPATSDADLDRAADQAAVLLEGFVYARERMDLEVLIGRQLVRKGASLATAESCTGGLIGERITAVSGSSAYYAGGIISYADAAKVRQLGVTPEALQRAGAVSEEVARQMAEGVRKQFDVAYGLAVTGIAGPEGGTPEKPIGLVYIALATPDGTEVIRNRFHGNRETIRERTCQAALTELLRSTESTRERTL